jgi:hypothetical protein
MRKRAKLMEYNFSITATYDNETTPYYVGRYTDAITAVTEWNKIVDWGFADEFATYNFSEPTGKMHTKIFYRKDRKVVTR